MSIAKRIGAKEYKRTSAGTLPLAHLWQFTPVTFARTSFCMVSVRTGEASSGSACHYWPRFMGLNELRQVTRKRAMKRLEML